MSQGSMTALPGRDRDLAELLAESAAVCAGHGGRTTFVAGDDGAGRSGLLRALAQQAPDIRPRPRVVAGAFQAGQYVAWQAEPARQAKLVAVLKRMGATGRGISAMLGDLGMPYGGLLAQVLADVEQPLDELERMFQPAPADLSELAPRALRLLCDQGPVVCIVDAADQALIGGLWADLVLGFASNVAGDLPLMLVLGMDGPQELGEHEVDETAALSVARQLCQAKIARWHALAPIDMDALRRWTGPATPDALAAALAVTEGRAAWTAALWREWQQRGILDDVTTGRWGFVDGTERHLDEVADLLRDRLKRRIPSHDLDALARAYRIAACAALEGRRFTPAAVASALHLDPDETIDLLDDVLTVDEDHDAGLVIDDGWIDLQDEHGERHVAIYSFAREIDWLTLRRYGLSPGEQRALSSGLADGLAATWGGESHRVAHTLTRLYELAEQLDTAEHFRRMADSGVDRAITLQRARAILSAPDPTDRAARHRACQVLRAAALELYHSGPFPEGLAFAEAGHRLAVEDADRAETLRYMGVHRKHLGDFEDARALFNAAIDLYQKMGDRHGEVRGRHSLAVLELGDDDVALAEFTRLAQLYRELDLPRGEAASRRRLAVIELGREEYDRGRTQLTHALRLFRDLGDRRGEAGILDVLGTAALLVKDPDEARKQFERALDMYRELRDESGEAEVLLHLATLDYQQGHHNEARRAATRAVALLRGCGDRYLLDAAEEQLKWMASDRPVTALRTRLRTAPAPPTDQPDT